MTHREQDGRHKQESALGAWTAGNAGMRRSGVAVENHWGMLSDPIRMEAYRSAIEQALRPGDTVVDLGAGLGILSLMAVRAGAKRVYAIEKEDTIEIARAVAERNGAADKIVFIQGKSREIELPERANLLVSETLGSFGIDENTLGFTADARERFLEPNARLIPEKLRLWLAPLEAPGVFSRAEQWRDLGGFDFSAAIEASLECMGIISATEENLLGDPAELGEFDFYRVREGSFSASCELEIQRDGVLHGLVGWFEVDLFASVGILTSPDSPPTHWQQAFFPVRQGLPVKRGQHLRVDLRAEPDGDRDSAKITYELTLA